MESHPDLILSADVKNKNKTVKLLEYRLILECSAVANVQSLNDKITSIIESDVPNKITFSKKENYKAHVSVRVNSNQLRPEIFVCDTGTGLNLNRTSLLPTAWQQKIKPATSVLCRSAYDDHITVFDTIIFLMWLRDLQVPVWFGVVDKLTVLILIGTSYISQLIECTHPRDCLIAPVHSGPVAIMPAHGPAVKSITTVHIAEAENTPQLSDPLATVFRVPKQAVILQNTEMMVPVRTLESRLQYLLPHRNALRSWLALAVCI